MKIIIIKKKRRLTRKTELVTLIKNSSAKAFIQVKCWDKMCHSNLKNTIPLPLKWHILSIYSIKLCNCATKLFGLQLQFSKLDGKSFCVENWFRANEYNSNGYSSNGLEHPNNKKASRKKEKNECSSFMNAAGRSRHSDVDKVEWASPNNVRK